MEKKVTKKDVLIAINALVSTDAQVEVEDVIVTGKDIADYVTKTIEQLENKATKARERAAEKKVEGDALRDAVANLLTDEFQTIDDITRQIEMEDVTKSKITARLTQLVKADMAHKTQVKTPDGRKVMGYAAGPAIEEDPIAE